MDPSHSISKVRNARLNRSFSNDVLPGLHTLSPLDPKSEEFLELFRSFLSKDERATILALSREDARVFIEIIDRVRFSRIFSRDCSVILSLNTKALREARLDIELEKIAFSVLKELCGEIGHLPDSYLLSCRLEPAVIALAPGRFSHIQKGSFEGKDVAVKSLRILKFDGEIQVRKHFCEEITVWRNLSHPNVLNLIGVSDTIEEGRLSVVYEWMANGNIMEYVRTNAGNHLKLLEDAVEGLKYLHQTGIVHGNLKGANILITNTEPISACLADFGFMTIVLNQIVGTRVAKPEVDEWTTPFVAPERLLLSEFVLENGAPTMEGDIYAMAMTTYQVLTGTLPFGEQTGPEVVAQVLEGARPSKPMNALDLGLSDVVWKLLEDCWQKEPHLRPPVEDFLSRVKSAASVCGTLSPVGGFPQRNEDPDSDLMKFDQLFLGMTHDESEAIARLPSHDSDTSASNSLFSETSEVSKTESTFTEPLPAFLFNPAPDHARELRQLHRTAVTPC
ncbi:kinase-like domain-containing protein [Thelephora terrestris]|uniref:Kinase-like domain-containing protein n=1 Tax=Thelephora terrestris TaxID=56493 RepID=A0A9P6H836_9AGAM|nr:kinase-like domain-containing protein [Thelephora terrestris]